MATKLPSIAVRNALAFVDFHGDWPSHLRWATRWAAERHGVQFNNHEADRRATGRYYYVTDEGRAIANTGTLAPCLAWAKENGFRIHDKRRRRARGSKPGSIWLINPDTGETAFIASGRVVYRNHELAFEGKPSKLITTGATPHLNEGK